MSKPGPTEPVSVPDAEPEAVIVSLVAVVSPLELSSEPPHPAAASAAAAAATDMAGQKGLICPPSIVGLSPVDYAAAARAVLADLKERPPSPRPPVSGTARRSHALGPSHP